MSAGEGDPRYDMAFGRDLRPHDYGKRRVGHPRQNWIKETTREFWCDVVQKARVEFSGCALDLDNDEHVGLIRDVAKAWNDRRTG